MTDRLRAKADETISDRMVTVCDRCFRASCWNGVWPCDEYRTGGTVEKPMSELIELDLEHPDNWDIQK